MRLVHLGLGNFFRAHQAWYTAHCGAEDAWGYAAFAGRSSGLADRMNAQDGRYTLVTRGPQCDEFELIESVVRSHRAGDRAAWLDDFASPELAVVTLTVTEAGYLRRADGSVDLNNPALAADLAALDSDPQAAVTTAPARLVSGLAARRRAGAGPLAVVACDNLASNAGVTAGVTGGFAERYDRSLAQWIAEHVSFVSTTVDRITPRPTSEDAEMVFTATGRRDACPVVTEPFSEWVLQGDFPAGRPPWERSGATFTADVTPYENRKLWLLNGAHSLLAYTGPIRGHATVAEAIGDPACREWVEQWWALAAPHLTQPRDVIDAYCRALLDRWANPRIRHQLAQIAADGSQKLPMRVLPVLRAERAGGAMPLGAARILAAWICHVRGIGAPVSDVAAGAFREDAAQPLPTAVSRLLGRLDPTLADDSDLVQAVAGQARELTAMAQQ